MITPDIITHQVSFAIRFVDHFSGGSVSTELPVRLDETFQRPAERNGGNGYRHSDGTYRFLSVPQGPQRVLWRDPFQRVQSDWTSWDADPEITLPHPTPATPVEFTLWPTANALVDTSATGIRGKLIGPNAAGLTVRIAGAAEPFDRFTRSDTLGEFLFLPPGGLTTDPAGLATMQIEVRNPDDTARAVAGGRFSTPAAGANFIGSNFTLTPGRVSRILFQIA